jgi:hypothetical protein
MSEQVARIRRQDLLDDETLVHLYAIKLEMKLLHNDEQRQIEDEQQDLVANAAWMMVALWHAVNEDRHCILNSIEETILMVGFKDMILGAILQAADDAAEQDDKRRLLITFNRLFAPRCQRILMNGFRIPDPFQWRIVAAPQRSQVQQGLRKGSRQSTTRSRSGSQSVSGFRYGNRSTSKGRLVTYNPPHGFLRRRSTPRSQSPPGILQHILPNLARARIRTPQYKGKTEREIESQEEKLRKRVKEFFNDWKPEGSDWNPRRSDWKPEGSGSDADSPFPPRASTSRSTRN